VEQVLAPLHIRDSYIKRYASSIVFAIHHH